MKKRSKKVLALLGACILMAGCLGACGSERNDSGNSTADNSSKYTDEQSMQQDAEESLSGSVLLVGSTSMEKLSSALAEGFMEKYPDIEVNVEYVGSSAGIESLLNGSADIGNSSRNLKEQEVAGGAVENVVAIDGIAVCVDATNTVGNLTKEQLADIYLGKVTNWKDVGGADMPITVVGREAGSGTRGAFEELLKVEDACVYANELDSTGAVKAKVSATPGAIGYISMDAVDSTVTALALNDVAATVENVKAGDYFLSRPFVMATKGEISEQSKPVKTWFEYVLGAEGQDIASDIGLITVE